MATIFECLSDETLCVPKPFQDAVPSSSRSKLLRPRPRRRDRPDGALGPWVSAAASRQIQRALHHLAQSHPECGRFGEFNGSDARPVRLQSPARENVKTSFRSKLLFTRSSGPLIRPGQFAAMDRAASGKVAFSARRTVETLVVPLMRLRCSNLHMVHAGFHHDSGPAPSRQPGKLCV